MTELGAARISDPSTSHAAAESVNATYLEGLVFEEIKKRKGGMTWDELFEVLGPRGIAKASISPRFRPLRDKGMIESRTDFYDKPIKRKGTSGRGQLVWFARNVQHPL